MEFGGFMYFTDYAMGPAAFARALEERGFESIWAPDHSHTPASRKTPWPGGAELPRPYYELLDPFVCLTAAAAVTSTLRLGTGVCLVNQRDPIQTAKIVASLDQVSAGRVLFGVGIGWNREEMENHGTVFDTRAKLVRERIEAMKEIWTKTHAEYHGDLVAFDPVMAWPKPAQKPHPPIIVGGGFPHGARRALRYGNGWIPIAGRTPIHDDLASFRQMVALSGRDPAEVPVSTFGGAETLDDIKRLHDLGVSRIVVMLAPQGEDMVLPVLDRWATLIRQAR